MYCNILVVTTGKGVQLISVNSKARGLNAVSQQAVELLGRKRRNRKTSVSEEGTLLVKL